MVALAEIAAGFWCGVACLIAGRLGSSPQVGRSSSGSENGTRGARPQRKLAEAREALAAGRSTDALRAIRSAVVGLIADMRNIVAEGLTASEADAILAETAVPAAERAEVLRLLEAIESAEYGSGVASRSPGDDRSGPGDSSRAWPATWNEVPERCSRIVPILIALFLVIPRTAVAGEPGSRERTFIRATRGL